MVAYSFKQQFRAPILAGTKRQTIRAERKRHARLGEQVQLYTGMRTRQCAIIGRAVCERVLPVILFFKSGTLEINGFQDDDPVALDAFAVRDGFADWATLARFWRATHGSYECFGGMLIKWGELVQEPPHASP